MTGRERLFAATVACCNAFFDGGCVYLEIRTTPKPLADGTSSDQYVATVLAAMQRAVDERNAGAAAGSVATRANLLLSLNRKTAAVDAAHAPEVLALAGKYRAGCGPETVPPAPQALSQHRVAVTGIDLCGDTYCGSFRKDLEPWLRRAQQEGWPLTVHCGERDDDEEVHAMLLLAPRRLGHCVFVNDAARELIATAQVPLELCLSSNITTGGLASVHDHHIRDWIAGTGDALHSHPIAICTDDFSVFHTDLRREVLLFAEVIDALHESVTTAQQRRPKLDAASADKADDAAGARDGAEAVRRRIEVVVREIFRAQATAARSAFMRESDRALLLQHITSRCVEWFAAFRAITTL